MGGVYNKHRAGISGSSSQKTSNWPLTFFRLKCLADPLKALDRLLESDGIFEAAEVFATKWMESRNVDGDASIGNSAGDDGGNLVPTLRLLRAWKRSNNAI
jgi:hypothetical protein